MISAENISFEYFKGIKVLDNIDFRFKKGIFYAVCGQNGCGKTTLLKIISGIIKNYSGSVKIFDDKNELELKKMKENDISNFISYLPSDLYFNFDLSVREVLLMGRRKNIGFFSFYGPEDEKVVFEASSKMNIKHILERKLSQISNGERQMVLIAQSYIQNTPFIIIDEPTSHLDIKHRIEIMKILKDMVLYENRTVISVMHDIKLASHYCDEFLFIKEGKIAFNIKSSEFELNAERIADLFEIDKNQFLKFI